MKRLLVLCFVASWVQVGWASSQPEVVGAAARVAVADEAPVDRPLPAKSALSVVAPSTILSPAELVDLRAETLTDTAQRKMLRLRQKGEAMLREGPAQIYGVGADAWERLVKFIEYMKEHKKVLLRSKRNLYVQKEGGYLDFPVQFYPSGHIYFYLTDFDPEKKAGGAKEFSRGIDYDTEKAWAHLDMPLLNNHYKRLARHELRIMRRFNAADEQAGLLGYRDAGSYAGYRNGTLCRIACFEARLCKQGDLMKYCAEKKVMPLGNARDLALQAAHLVQRLHHKKHILHRDLKLDNFGLDDSLDDESADAKDEGQLKLRLIDFGLAEKLTPKTGYKFCGSFGLIAPEVCLSVLKGGRAFLGAEAGKKVEVYALGVVFLQILKRPGGYPLMKTVRALDKSTADRDSMERVDPIYALLGKQTEELAVNLRKPSDGRVARNFIGLIVDMLQMDPAKRPDLAAVIERLEMLDQE